jgi:hypothetical protein
MEMGRVTTRISIAPPPNLASTKLPQSFQVAKPKPCQWYACFILDIARANRENPRVNHAKYSIEIPPRCRLHAGREHKRLLSLRGFKLAAVSWAKFLGHLELRQTAGGIWADDKPAVEN